MAYSLSLHNGSRIAREHNRRNEKICRKEGHIHLKGRHENIIDISPQKAYEDIFGDALKEYNQKMIDRNHAERIIPNYLHHIRKNAKKHEAYELIVSIGNQDKQPPVFVSESILKEYLDGWKERNPNLILIGAYYHADEFIVKDGKQITNPHPHLHLDYIGVAKGLKKGLSVQNSLVKALEQQGFKTTGIHNTAQIQWQNSEREALEKICKTKGLEIEHPELSHKEHMKIQEYKAAKEIERLNSEVKDLEGKMVEGTKKYNKLVDIHTDLIDKISALKEGSLELAKEIVERYKERTIDLIR